MSYSRYTLTTADYTTCRHAIYGVMLTKLVSLINLTLVWRKAQQSAHISIQAEYYKTRKRSDIMKCFGVKQTFGQMLKSLRTEKYLTQKDFASLLGLQTSTLRNWERDVNLPNTTHIRFLLEFLPTKGFNKDILKKMSELWKESSHHGHE